MKMLKH